VAFERIYLDAREMEHPVPLERAIASLRQLDDDNYFHMYHRKYPVPLIDMAQAQGFRIVTEQTDDGLWHILIARNHNIPLEELLDV
jgi:hypothetical protein